MIEQLIARVFATRNAAHLLHWRGPSYAQHMALGDFYEAIIDKLDEIVECHQGETGEPIGGIGEPASLADRQLDLFRISSHRGQVELHLLGHRIQLPLAR